MKEMLKEFDAVREIVYVADPETYELLFLNKSGLYALGYWEREEVTGKKCYEILQGKNSPCEFCNNAKLCRGEYLEWEFENPITKRAYRLKDKLIDWDGRDVRLEIADDFTAAGERRRERERVVMECVRQMYSSIETDVAIDNTLRALGTYLGGERTYIFHVHGKYMDNIYEWCAEGISKEIDSLQNVPVSVMDRWLPAFSKNECVILRDVEEIRESAPDEYAILTRQNIRSLITVPMFDKGNLSGYFGIDNPDIDNASEISYTLKMLAYFFESLLERKKREDYLKKIGFTDEMTGALNRNAFIRDTMDVDEHELARTGVVFVDINGLKRANDELGHEAGDALIRKVYALTCEIVGNCRVYRLGGDEFVVLCLDVPEEKFVAMVGQLKDAFDGRNDCSAAIGSSFREEPQDLNEMIKDADQQMYLDKKRYYEESGKDRRQK